MILSLTGAASVPFFDNNQSVAASNSLLIGLLNIFGRDDVLWRQLATIAEELEGCITEIFSSIVECSSSISLGESNASDNYSMELSQRNDLAACARSHIASAL